VEVSRNFVATRGEGIEFESCGGPGSVYVVERNTVVVDAAPSPYGFLVRAGGLQRAGGHPAAIKMAGVSADSFEILKNDITMSGSPAGVCIMANTTNPDSTNKIAKNTCEMDGQFAGLLGGFVAVPGLFPAASLSGTQVRKNVFLGDAELGIALIDLDLLGLPLLSLINDGHDNVFRKNDLSQLEAATANVFFGVSTFDNLFMGDPGGPVVDLGVGNVFK
jgi:hypothetical protein